jgi:APA family basic amino acid/polyamine antiporter
VSFAGIGVILGAGVYALIGPAAAHAGNALWLSFLLAGITAALTAYAYARLGSMQPKNSAEFQYTALAFGPRAGFMAGWLMLVADLFAAAAVAVGFGTYVTHLVGTPIALNALALLLIVGVVLYTGVTVSVGLAIVLTGAEPALHHLQPAPCGRPTAGGSARRPEGSEVGRHRPDAGGRRAPSRAAHHPVRFPPVVK